MNTIQTVKFYSNLHKLRFYGSSKDYFTFLKRSFLNFSYPETNSPFLSKVNCKQNVRLLEKKLVSNSFRGPTRKIFFSSTTETTEGTPPLNKENAESLVMRLTTEERNALMTALQELEAEQTKAEYRGQLAAFRWRSRFGRPSKLPRLGDVDPTGSYCPVPEDWLLRKYAETIPKPTTNQLFAVAIHNATPFVGFGFLDNFFMLICGEYIETYLGSVITISTMAAAALGNTLSDILGIGSAFYVERAVSKIGVKPPNLSPIQLDMISSRLAANWGRVIGVTIGCLLGMTPLLFKKDKDKNEAKGDGDSSVTKVE